MNYSINRRNLRLLARNEGKIKSYESCSDVRAWSHDLRTRDRYLRDWIKSDMPIGVIPARTLARFLRTMTCKSRGRAIPRCHPNCKSKVLLERICGSCHVMKECLANDQDFEKYFFEEELETSHWPCDRCLDALKTIKMFWKIIVEKIFNVKIPKSEDLEIQETDNSLTDSVSSVAKVWQSELVHQALFIKNITPLLRRPPLPSPTKETKCAVKEPSSFSKNSRKAVDMSDTRNVTRNGSFITKSSKSRTLNSDSKSGVDSNRMHPRRSRRKLSKCTSVRIEQVDVGCDSCNIERHNEELKAYKNNIDYLQEKFNVQTVEIERLKQENTSLRIELQNVYKCYPWKSPFYSPVILNSNRNSTVLVPKPFENCVEENLDTDSIKNTDSEMIITMKNCTNETFKHVSLLQVLHKTNEPIIESLNITGSCCRKEDPIDLLTKVQTTFSAIVRREIGIAGGRSHRLNKSDIEATFHRVNASRSAPSCSTISTYSTS